jgi:hypothetical protein
MGFDVSGVEATDAQVDTIVGTGGTDGEIAPFRAV